MSQSSLPTTQDPEVQSVVGSLMTSQDSSLESATVLSIRTIVSSLTSLSLTLSGRSNVSSLTSSPPASVNDGDQSAVGSSMSSQDSSLESATVLSTGSTRESFASSSLSLTSDPPPKKRDILMWLLKVTKPITTIMISAMISVALLLYVCQRPTVTSESGSFVEILRDRNKCDNLNNSTTPQCKAVDWMAENLPMKNDNVDMDSKFLLEQYAVVTFCYATGIMHFLLHGGTNICNWNNDTTGIFCNENQTNVVSISFSNGQYFTDGHQAMLPTELGYLSKLTTLNMPSNNITGTLPSEILRLESLEELHLQNNELSGLLPDLSLWSPSLSTVGLNTNEISGSISVSSGDLQHLAKLEKIFLYENRLSGTIPKELSHLSAIKEIDFGRNKLTGTLPSELGQLPQLTHLLLYDNELSGSIPSNFRGLTNLKKLGMPNNKLTGNVPKEIYNLENLIFLDLNFNMNLAGIIPQDVMTKLEQIFIHGTGIIGSLTHFACSPIAKLMWANCLEDGEVDCDCCHSCCDANGNNCQEQQRKG